MIPISRRALLLALLILATPPLQAVELKALETEDLRLLYFDPTETYLAPYAARCFTNSLASQKLRFGFDPDGKITVLMKDFSDYGNAAAGAIPRNTLLVDIAPVSFAYETFAPSERMYTLMNHELVHITTMDQSTKMDRGFRKLFGGKVSPVAEHPETILYSYLTAPRTATPRWYLEGSAVFMETWMAGGLGRAQGAYDEMVFRSMVRDGAHFYDPLGLVSEGSRIDFQVGVNAYLYGTRFISYLAYQYSPDKVIEWLTRPEGSKRYYSSQFEHVFDKSLDQSWAEWIAFEKNFQQGNLEAIRQYPVTPYRDITDQGLGSVSRAFLDPDRKTLYAGLRYPGVVAHLAALSVEEGSLKRLHDIKSPLLYHVTSLAYDPQAETLFYTSDNQAWRDLLALDLKTGKQTTLLKDERIGEMVLNPGDRSLWGIRQANGLATLVRIPAPYEKWEQVRTLAYGELMYDLDISPDGRLLSSSYGSVNGDQSLRVYDIASLLKGEFEPTATQDFGSAAPEGFVFDQSGRYLYGSSYFTGVSNIFRYDLKTSTLDGMSNAETGFFRPLPIDEDTLLVMRYSGDGFVPSLIDVAVLEDLSAVTFLGAQVAEKHPVVKQWEVPSPADVPLETLITRDDDYHPVSEMSLESVYPVLQGYKDSVAYGMHARFSDPISMHSLEITASYSPDDSLDSEERLHAKVLYEHMGFSADLRHNYADFYDLFGPTKTSLRGNSATLGYTLPLIYDKPRRMDLSTEISYYTNLDRVPYFQDVDATFDTMTSGQVSLNYENVNKSLGAVDEEKGFRWEAVVGANQVNSNLISFGYGRLDAGVELPLKHASLWLRNTGGVSNGDSADPFANYYFGGFGNNWVDHREIKRYREPFTMPGFEINELGGTQFGKSILEFNLPPVLFERAGTPGFFATWARPAVFASALVTDSDSDRSVYRNVGFQVDFQLFILSRLEMTLSLGMARGFSNDQRGEDEFMLSLKIL